MKRPGRVTLPLWLLLALVGPSAFAAQPEARPFLGYAYPAGARSGTTVELEVAGERIQDATSAWVSGEGVTATVVSSSGPVDPEKKNKKKGQGALGEHVVLHLSVAPGAAVGDRAIALITPSGMSNPRVFQIGACEEVAEQEPNHQPDKATPVPHLPAVLNGQIREGDRDLFRLSAKRGQHIVAQAAARALIPYIADAVPGWLQPVLTMSDTQGREIAYADHFGPGQDPVLVADIPADGDYLLTVRDAIWRGREDFVYRITVGELPLVTAWAPLGASYAANDNASVHLTGINLSSDRLDVALGRSDGVRWLTAERDGLRSNRFPFAIDGERTTAATPEALRGGQPVTPPCTIDGVLTTPAATFRFAGTTGQVVAVAVQARRLGSPLDARLVLTGPDGARVALADDVKDRAQGLLTHQADPELTVTLPATGTYTLRLEDVLNQGGADAAYRLRIGPPRPDAALRLLPSTLRVPRGGTAYATVQVLRRDGFTGPVTIDAAGLPRGVHIAGTTIAAGSERVGLTITADADAAPGVLTPRLTARLGSDGATRPVLGCEDEMQAFLWRHLVPEPAIGWCIAAEPAPIAVTADSDGPLRLVPGVNATVTLHAKRGTGLEGRVQCQLLDQPAGIGLGRAGIGPERDTAKASITVAKDLAVGTTGFLVFRAQLVVEHEEDATPAEPAKKPDEKKDPAPVTTAPATATAPAKPETPAEAPKEAPKKKIRRDVYETWTPAIPFTVVAAPARPDPKPPVKK